ncbi:MAG: hypothetical protein WDN29_14460 [Methylovirgula sp.]
MVFVSHGRWALLRPGVLGVGLVVSMAADAGQDAVIGASVAPHSILAITAPGDLIPATVSGAAFASTRKDGLRRKRRG